MFSENNEQFSRLRVSIHSTISEVFPKEHEEQERSTLLFTSLHKCDLSFYVEGVRSMDLDTNREKFYLLLIIMDNQ